MRNSKGGWLLYCMVHLPWFWKFKVGITSLSIGAAKRARDIDREMFGVPIPIMILPLPGAYYVEQEMHRIMARFNTRFTSASGRSEWFNVVPLFFTVPIMLAIWGLYLIGIDMALGSQIYPVVSGWFFEGLLFLIEKLLQ